MQRKIIKIILVIVWMGVIFSFSNEEATGSDKLSHNFIVRITKVVVGKKYNAKIEQKAMSYVTIVRKTAHAFIYFVLAVLSFSLFKEYFGITSKTIIYTVFLCLCYSISDEFHQMFIAGRSGELRDVLIDCSSAILATFLCYKITAIRKNKKQLD